MDGKKNVGDLAQMMESRFGKQVYPLYERLIVFCRCWSSSNSLRGKKSDWLLLQFASEG
ncbi:hypothetical protein M5E89_13555 [Acidaminococcus intestini]|nr:hypothetical protein M5E89_13555 [Acidaminococcus intestini]